MVRKKLSQTAARGGGEKGHLRGVESGDGLVKQCDHCIVVTSLGSNRGANEPGQRIGPAHLLTMDDPGVAFGGSQDYPTRELDRVFRKIAWQAVVDNPLSGVTDEDGNGVGDDHD